MLLRVGMPRCLLPPTQAPLQSLHQPADLPQAGKERLYPEPTPVSLVSSSLSFPVCSTGARRRHLLPVGVLEGSENSWTARAWHRVGAGRRLTAPPRPPRHKRPGGSVRRLGLGFPGPQRSPLPLRGGLGRQVGRAGRGRSPGAAAGGRLRAAGRAHNSVHCLGPAGGAGAAGESRAPGG